MNSELLKQFSKVEIFQYIDGLKNQIDKLRPLPGDVEGKIIQKLRLDWNYHSNAIEGNRLSYGETVAFLMEGITAKGKPLKDHLDIRGHNEAINFLLSVVKDSRPIFEADIRALHKMILVEPYTVKAQTADGLPTTKKITLGEYKVLPNHVKTATGAIHYYATPEETSAKMQELMVWYNDAINNEEVHPAVIAAVFHHKFVAIHPFDDGNGRLSRILMNLILMQKGYPPVIIKMDDRQNYYGLLSQSDAGDHWPFIEYIAERLRNSLQLFLRGAQGGDIEEDEDLDKEIALFKMELQNNVHIKEKKSIHKTLKIIIDDLQPLFQKVSKKTSEFNDFFFSNSNFFDVEILKDSKKVHLYIQMDDNELDKKLLNVSFDYISYFCTFHEFKNHKTPFNLAIIWRIYFNDYNYTINDENNKEIISKYYHENISIIEQQTVIRQFIDVLKLRIQFILKSPESN